MIVAVGENEGRRTFFINLTAEEVGNLTAGVVMRSESMPGFPTDIEICLTTMPIEIFTGLLPDDWVRVEKVKS